MKSKYLKKNVKTSQCKIAFHKRAIKTTLIKL